MTVGIYKLSWKQDNAVYVGQSINIESRYKQHTSALEGKIHSNYKLQEKYCIYETLPYIEILEICEQSDLDKLEILWTEKLDSINNGLNIVAAGAGCGRGLEHAGSKYTKFQILKVFSLLYKTVLTYEKVAIKTRLNKYLVHNIANGNHHLWLKETYPDKFQIMLDNKKLRNVNNIRSAVRQGMRIPNLVSPNGEIYTITNIREFCRTHPVLKTWGKDTSSNIAKLLKGTKSGHKGWTVQK